MPLLYAAQSSFGDIKICPMYHSLSSCSSSVVSSLLSLLFVCSSLLLSVVPMADIAARPSEESINSLSLFLSRGTLFGFVKPPSSSLFSSFLGNVLKTAAKQRDYALFTAPSRCLS